MPKFSERSKRNLSTCDPALIALFNEVVKHFDCSIIEGHRSDLLQEKAFENGTSQLRAGQSQHNKHPSLAVDVAPYPIDWDDRERFYYFAGHVMGLALSMGIKLRYGGDWAGNKKLSDNSFDDLVHFSLIDEL